MSIYDDSNIIDFDPSMQSTALVRQLSKSRQVENILQELGESSEELDDSTGRALIKFQTRQLVHRMFEKVHLALDTIDRTAMDTVSLKDASQIAVGLTGRISTLVNSLIELEKLDQTPGGEWFAKLKLLPREEMMQEVREKFLQLFGRLFTDEELTSLMKALEQQHDEAEFGEPERASTGEGVGSARWRPRTGPTGVLPPVR